MYWSVLKNRYPIEGKFVVGGEHARGIFLSATAVLFIQDLKLKAELYHLKTLMKLFLDARGILCSAAYFSQCELIKYSAILDSIVKVSGWAKSWNSWQHCLQFRRELILRRPSLKDLGQSIFRKCNILFIMGFIHHHTCNHLKIRIIVFVCRCKRLW